MKRIKQPVVSLSALIVIAIGVFAVSCRFSFAESKKPEKGSITFGAGEKPEVEIPPQLHSFKTVFADIAEKVTPTVVSVIPTKIDTVVYNNNPFYRHFDPFDFFFGPPPGRQQQPQQPEPKKQERRRSMGLGSGVIVSKDGYILTNNHVVAGADEIEVRLTDDRSFDAEIVGRDSLSDVAVIKIKEKVENLPVAYLGDSEKLRPGDWVVAIGNPFSLTSSVTAGIVSALGRYTSGSMYQNFIQTDAAINPGNSGGALVNIDGELVGINTMIYTRSGGYMGIGFAIPINMARWIMEDLIYRGEVSRGWLGVKIQNLNNAMREALGIDDQVRGVLIAEVFDGQPAARAGIKVKDVVLFIDGRKVENVNQLRNTVASIDPGKSVPIVVIRNGKKKSLNIKLGSRPDNLEDISGEEKQQEPEEQGNDEIDITKKLGIKVADVSSELRRKYKLDTDERGVVIVDVKPLSQAAQEGLREGDVLTEVTKNKERFTIDSAKKFKSIARQFKPGDSILFLLKREGNTFFVAYKLKK
ncbi:MAG: Do family serine endopeptidase [Chitinivibrionales bacterium]|nr:Do family serine endopeptidase [Chitinivibrionales bacterium]